MRTAKIAILATLVVTVGAMALFVAACGGKTDTTVTGAATSIQVMTTAAAPTTTTAAPTTTTAAATIETYRIEMKALWDQYGAKLNSIDSALSMEDPTNLTPAEIASIESFVVTLKGFVAGMAKIQPPAEVAEPHAKYLDVMTRLSDGLDKFATAAKAGDTAAVGAALFTVIDIVQKEDVAMKAAEAALEKALGFSLSTDSSTTTTGLTDALTYTSTKYGYAFQYPGTWKIDESAPVDAAAGSGATSTVGAYDPDGAQANSIFIDLMVVSTYELGVTITSDNIAGLEGDLQTMLDDLKTQAPDATILVPLTQTEAAGLPGYSVTYSFSKDGVPTTSTLYFLFKGNMEYQVSLQAASADWDKYQATFAAMLATFTAP